MMVRALSLLAGIAALTAPAGAALAAPTTYAYVGPAFGTFQDFTGPCPGGQACANYAAGQKVTITFTTADALPADLPATDISVAVTSYSAADGVNTYASGDGSSVVAAFTVKTDGYGNIDPSGTTISLQRWASGAAPHVANERLSELDTAPTGDQGSNNIVCDGVSAGGFACMSGHADAASSYAQAAPGGSWATTPPPVVPTLGQWAMSALALMLAGLSLASRRARAQLI